MPSFQLNKASADGGRKKWFAQSVQSGYVLRAMKALLLFTVLTACAGSGNVSASADVDVTASGGAEEAGSTVTRAGHAGRSAVGGSSAVIGSAGESVGGIPVEPEPNVGGAGAPPMVVNGGGEGGDGTQQAPSAGAGGDGGGSAGEPSIAPVDPYKQCDGKVCAENELCVHTSATVRICTPINDQFGRCDPYSLPNPNGPLANCCAGKSIECSTIYKKCGTMDDLQGNDCGQCSGVSDPGAHYFCGPPL